MPAPTYPPLGGRERGRVRRSTSGDKPVRWWWDRDKLSWATAAEFIVVFPLFMILVLGLFSLGVMWYRQLSLTQAAREGARYAATVPTGYPDDSDTTGTPTDDWLTLVADKVTSSAVQWQEVCVAYTGLLGREGETDTITARLVRDSNGDTIMTGTPCYADGDMSNVERRVQVRVTTSTFFNAFAYGTELNLGGAGTARFEAVYPDE
jgi:Flp pilus assembly protein TadG